MKVAILSSIGIFFLMMSCSNPLPPFPPVHYPMSPWFSDSLASAPMQEKYIPYDTLPIPQNTLVPDSGSYEVITGKKTELYTQVLFRIDEEGNPHAVSIVESSGTVSFDQATMDRIMDTRFKPAMKDQKPVGVWITLVISAE